MIAVFKAPNATSLGKASYQLPGSLLTEPLLMEKASSTKW